MAALLSATAPLLPAPAVDGAALRAQMREVAARVRESFSRRIGPPEAA
jgi:hypothetical protein